MALPNDSILVTPGAGATVATHLVGSKEYQVIMQASENGHIIGSKDTYVYNIPEQVHVAAANTIHWDLFNADAALLVRVTSIQQRPSMTTSVTGVVFAWDLIRTTSVGTTGTPLTAWLPDLSQPALDADITARSKPGGGAASGVTLLNYSVHGEETNAAANMFHMMMAGGVADLVPRELRIPGSNPHGILLRQNQGIKCVQVTNSAAGNTGWVIVFTVE